MPLTPDDIVNFPLDQAFRGYAVQQVDELLDQVADELERLQLALHDTRRDLERAEERASSVEATETTLRRTLITAQQAAEQTIEDARQRAEKIIDEAEETAERIERTASDESRVREVERERRIELLDARLDALRAYEREYRENLRAITERQLRMLDEIGELEPDATLPAAPPPIDTSSSLSSRPRRAREGEPASVTAELGPSVPPDDLELDAAEAATDAEGESQAPAAGSDDEGADPDDELLFDADDVTDLDVDTPVRR